MADAYDRAYDPARVPQIEKHLASSAALRGVDMTGESHRDLNYVHGFVGPAKNGVRTRPQEPGERRSTYRWIQSPADYNEASTAITNRAKSGATAKDAMEREERRNAGKPREVIKINTDPAKGK